MTPESIRSELAAAQKPSDAALREAVRQAGVLAPEVLALLEKADRGVFLLPNDARLLLHGIHVLAAARDQRLYRPLLGYLRRPDTLPGNALTETMPRVVLSVFDGDAAPLFAAIEDREADELLRWSLFAVLARLAFDGSIAREAAVKLLHRFDAEGMAGPGNAAWLGWQDAVSLLGVAELADRARAAASDGRRPEWAPESEDLAGGAAAMAYFQQARLAPIDDPVEALTSEGYPEPPAPEGAEADKDPAARVALDGAELQWLAGFLSSRQVPPSTMCIDELDGLFTALAIYPEEVPPGEFLALVWGTPDGSGPDYDTEEQAQHVSNLMVRHWLTIHQRLRRYFPHTPLFLDAPEKLGSRWLAGFNEGVGLRFDAWQRISRHAGIEQAMGLVHIAGLEPSRFEEAGLSRDAYRRVLDQLPEMILVLHYGWRATIAEQAPLRRHKVGRNEPCECGSGRKFKRCCGAVAADAA